MEKKYSNKLKGGFKNMESVNFAKTKAGNGFKIVINGKWFYTSKKELYKVLKNEAKACSFRTITEKKA